MAYDEIRFENRGEFGWIIPFVLGADCVTENPVHISLIICTRNRADDLQATLAALALSKLPEGLTAELIVVDNGSVDRTRQVVESIGTGALGKRYLFEPLPGKSRALNCAMAVARGEVIAFTDDDVRAPPDWLGALTRPLFSGAADVAVGKVVIASHLERPWITPAHRVYFGSTEMTQMPDFVGANVALHRRVLERVPDFDVRLGPGQLGYGDDTLFALRLARAGFRFRYVEEAVVEHHFDPARLSRESLLEMNRRFGRTAAYLGYHWLGRKVKWVWLRLLKAIARLLLWRCMHLPALRRAEGIDTAEARRLSGVHFYWQWLRETRGPRAYQGNNIRIAILASGEGRTRRGGEAYARDLFVAMKNTSGIEAYLLKGGRQPGPNEVRVPSLYRESALARWIGGGLGKSGLWMELVSFFVFVFPALLWLKPDVIYCTDHAVFRGLFKARRLLKSALGTFSGVQLSPLPADKSTFFHFVTPPTDSELESLGFSKDRIWVIPHFIPDWFLERIGQCDASKAKLTLQARFAIPPGMKTVVTVGSLDISVKRMDWLVREVARTPDWFLLMVGAETSQTSDVMAVAREYLPGRHAACRVSRAELPEILKGSDTYVSASLREGFGLANLEAALCGVPVVVHRDPTIESVLGDYPIYADLRVTGVLPALLGQASELRTSLTEKAARLTTRYSERELVPRYVEMMRMAAVVPHDSFSP